MQTRDKARRSKLYAGLATATGVFLLGSELARAGDGIGFESWFWIVVAALLVVLGLAGLLLPPAKGSADLDRLDPP